MSQVRRFALVTGVLLVVAAASSGAARGQQSREALLFVADMRGAFVAQGKVETTATAKATGVLVGNRFTVHGSFIGLSSPLRDIEKLPEDPGIHLHRGAPGETTPYFHGLQVRLNADGRSGIFFGTATLDSSLAELLLSGRTYVDIHTVKFGPGEVRDQWRPVDPAAAAARLTHLIGQSAVPPTSTAGASCHQ
jgi:hypothetical protein